MILARMRQTLESGNRVPRATMSCRRRGWRLCDWRVAELTMVHRNSRLRARLATMPMPWTSRELSGFAAGTVSK